MRIRSFRPSDLEPLYQLYVSLVARMPHHPRVGLEQFADQLLSTTCEEPPGVFLPDGQVALVAEEAGRAVAFACGSFLQQDARHSDLKPGAGVLRFVLASPQDREACRAVIRAIVEHGRALHCRDLRALMSQYGPPFHNYGSARLTNAWPWIGHSLLREGFRTHGDAALEMHRTLNDPLERLPLPPDATLRYDWVTRIGMRDEWEGGYHLFMDEQRAAETMYYYGEKFVRGLGKDTVYLFWLGVNDPFRGRGFGRFLLRHALVTAQEQGARETCLRADPENFAALSIYRAEGYESSDILWEFKLDREDRI